MIIEKQLDVKTNVSHGQAFKISENSIHLFRMLSDFLYSNKELCVLHELCANAVDEHKRFGIPDTPIEIVAPTSIDPKLTIRDFGEGLSEEMVYKLLTTYGESGDHKRVSNEFYGAWGIGSKSVAAVTKTWEVKSYHHGEMKSYLVFIDDKGVPTITKTFTAETPKSGLEIIIPVNPNKFYTWNDLYRHTFKHYPVKPNIKNATVTYPKESDNAIKFPTWKFDSNNHRVIAVINAREYNIDLTKVMVDNTSSILSMMRHVEGLVLYFDTGVIDLSLSRETVQYTKTTVDAIRSKIEDVVFQELKSSVLAGVASATNKLEYQVALTTQIARFNRHFSYSRMNPLVGEMIKGNTFGVFAEDIDIYLLELPNGQLAKCIYKNKLRTVDRNFNAWRTNNIKFGIAGSGNPALKIRISSIDNCKFVIADVRNTPSRAKDYAKALPNSFTIVLPANTVVPAELSKWTIKASILPAPVIVRTPKAKRQAVESKLFAFHNGCLVRTKEDEVKKEKAIGFNFTDGRTASSIVGDRPKSRLIDIGFVYIGTKVGEPWPAWLRTEEEVVNDAKKNVDFTKYVSYREMFNNKAFYDETSIHALLKNNWTMVSHITTGPIPELVGLYERSKAVPTYKLEEYIKYVEALCDKLPEFVTTTEVTRSIFDKYPMLKYTSKYHTDFKDIVAYINLIEGVK
jgi:hypothetical protein